MWERQPNRTLSALPSSCTSGPLAEVRPQKAWGICKMESLCPTPATVSPPFPRKVQNTSVIEQRQTNWNITVLLARAVQSGQALN